MRLPGVENLSEPLESIFHPSNACQLPCKGRTKNIVLFDQDTDLLKEENETSSVDGVNGSEIVLGSLTEVSVNGNWPTIFDATQ